MNKKITDYEDDIIRKAYGKNAKPTLIEDKSIEGLIRANVRERKTDWSIVRFVYNLAKV